MRHGILFSLAGIVGLFISAQTHASVPDTIWVASDAGVLAVGYAPDGKSLIDVEVDATGASIRVLSHRTFESISTRRVSGEWHSAAIAPNGQWVALGGVNKVARIEIASGRQTDLMLEAAYFPRMAISDDSLLLAAAAFRHPDDDESLIHIWSVATGKVIGTCKCKGDLYSGIPMTFSPSGDLLRVLEFEPPSVAADHRKRECTPRLKEWQVGQSRFVRSIALQKSESVMATSCDGKLIALGSVSEEGPCRIRLVETEHYQTVKTLVRTGYPLIRLLAFARDGRSLISCALAADSLGHKLSAWDVATGQECAATDPIIADPRILACAPDGNEVIAGGANAQFATFRDADFKMHAVLEVWSLRGPLVADSTPEYSPPDPNVPIPLWHDEPVGISSETASRTGIREVIRREGWFGRADQPIREGKDSWLVSVWHWPKSPGGVRIVRVGDDGKVRSYQRGK